MEGTFLYSFAGAEFIVHPGNSKERLRKSLGNSSALQLLPGDVIVGGQHSFRSLENHVSEEIDFLLEYTGILKS